MRQTMRDILASKGSDVVSVTLDASVLDAVRIMNEHRIGAVVVLVGENLVGIFTERDVLSRVVAVGLEPRDTPVTSVMTELVITVPATVSVEEAMTIVTEKRCRHLPVMDGDTLLGMVSAGDLVMQLTRGQKYEIRQLINYVTRKYPA